MLKQNYFYNALILNYRFGQTNFKNFFQMKNKNYQEPILL